MDTKDIIEAHLKANGFDGLYRDECGCQIGDLIPCGEMDGSCRPGFNDPARAAKEGDKTFWIGPKTLERRIREACETKGVAVLMTILTGNATAGLRLNLDVNGVGFCVDIVGNEVSLVE